MASSGYHYSKYKEYQKEQNKFANWLKQLREIERSFSDWSLTGQPDDVNGKLSRCKSSKDAALNGDGTFDQNLAPLEEARENPVSSDADLSGAHSAIQREITRIQGKHDYAQGQKSYHWQQYMAALAREAAGML